MRSPARNARSAAALSLLPLLLLIVASSTALAQVEPDAVRTGTEAATEYPWYIRALTSALFTLVVGGLLVALAPNTTQRCTDRALETPGAAFAYGFGCLIAVIGLAIVLAITVIGLVVAIPLLLLFALVSVIAGEFGYLAVGRLVNDGWSSALGFAIVVSAFVGAVPVLGTLVGFVLTSIGVGTVAMGVLSGR